MVMMMMTTMMMSMMIMKTTIMMMMKMMIRTYQCWSCMYTQFAEVKGTADLYTESC